MTDSICPNSANTQPCWEELKPLRKQLPPEEMANLVGGHGKKYKRGELSLRDAKEHRLRKALGPMYSSWVKTRRKINTLISFWTRVEVKGRDECWEWRSGRFKQTRDILPYGKCNKGLAHRKAWEIVNGPIPDGLNVLHKCDNPPCCNPDHLFLGTDKDNMQDALKKGRTRCRPVKGEDHPHAILTENEVREIRKLRDAGLSNRKIAAKFGVTIATVSAIYMRKIWKHLTQ